MFLDYTLEINLLLLIYPMTLFLIITAYCVRNSPCRMKLEISVLIQASW
jgi:hypothetical protein